MITKKNLEKKKNSFLVIREVETTTQTQDQLKKLRLFARELRARSTSMSSSLATKVSGNTEASCGSNAGSLHHTTVAKSTCLSSNVTEHVVDKGVQDSHTLARDSNLLALDEFEDEASKRAGCAPATTATLGLGLATRLRSFLSLASHVFERKEIG